MNTATLKRTSIAAIFATAIVGMAIAAPSYANESPSDALNKHTEQLYQMVMQQEQTFEIQLEKQMSQQVAKAERSYVKELCHEHDFGYDAETSSCIR